MNNENKIIEMLSNLVDSMNNLKEEVKGVNEKLDSLENRVNSLENNVNSRFDKLENIISVFAYNHDNNIKEIKKSFADAGDKITKINNDIKELQISCDVLERKQGYTERYISILESKIS